MTGTQEKKDEKSRQRRNQSIPWIANPFHKPHHYHPAATHDSSSFTDPKENAALAAVEEQLEEAEEVEEATPIELFYDLYFVANLTTVTSVHYITETTSLSSYCLYFIILWFTWLHVTLLDVRFSMDSVYERVCKGMHFATMAAFASVSARWDPFEPDTDLTVRALKTMTLTLMFSRFVLGIQYFVVLGFGLRSKKSVVAPLSIQGTSMIISGIVYLGIYFTFGNNDQTRSYIAWYVMVIFEVVAVVATSSIWPSVCFKKTHLVERMGLLTLIVMGEGIIVMLKAINTIVKGFGWTKSSFGVVVAALAIIYFFWMLYFDMSPKNAYFGKVRQQIWTILHFPFHLAIVLSVEGLRQLTTLYNTEQMGHDMFLSLVDAPLDEAMVRRFNETFELFYNDVYAKSIVSDWPSIKNWTSLLGGLLDGSVLMNSHAPDANITALADLGLQEQYDVSWAVYLQQTLISKASYYLLEFYGMKLPKGQVHGEYTALGALFNLVYKYFFISLAAIFVFYGVFAILARRQLDVFDWISITLRWIPAGVFIGFSTLSSRNPIYIFNAGAWPIPQVCVLIFVVLLLDNFVNHFAVRRSSK